ncbi:MAG: putative integral rane protein [Candidatus Adlerbacteria bacterium]|nr:putative integral rane protein [Candidatus Adlerbacteria bacterium]
MNHDEQHSATNTNSTQNWLRAAVLGANDGVVSVASIVVGVAAATDNPGFILTAGTAGLVAGALSMAVGEYVSVSTQRDTEKALLEKERYELEHMPEQELAELAAIYEGKGLSHETAQKVAQELTDHDAFAAHVEAELKIDPDDLTNPWHAAYASAAAFFSGAIIPLVAIVLPPAGWRIPVTFAAVLVVLIVTGVLSAHVGGANKTKATMRVVAGGIIAMIVTFGIGKIFGVVGI